MITVRVIWHTEKKEEERVCLPASSAVSDLLDAVQIKDHGAYLIVVNGTHRLPPHPLKNGDEIKLFWAMAGG